MSHIKKTNLEGMNLSFLRRYKFRLSEFVLLEKRDKFKASKFVTHTEKTNLDHLNMSRIKKDIFRGSEFVFF